mmetsp:Transcript_12439/g.26705  ORF Transcript_12439/g.26705 Transcript_12439/m.26705 type:complete len:264 (+) Transcript_12439:383-1174(+)
MGGGALRPMRAPRLHGGGVRAAGGGGPFALREPPLLDVRQAGRQSAPLRRAAAAAQGDPRDRQRPQHHRRHRRRPSQRRGGAPAHPLPHHRALSESRPCGPQGPVPPRLHHREVSGERVDRARYRLARHGRRPLHRLLPPGGAALRWRDRVRYSGAGRGDRVHGGHPQAAAGGPDPRARRALLQSPLVRADGTQGHPGQGPRAGPEELHGAVHGAGPPAVQRLRGAPLVRGGDGPELGRAGRHSRGGAGAVPRADAGGVRRRS